MAIYQWNQLGINEITSPYLYGQTSKPSDFFGVMDIGGSRFSANNVLSGTAMVVPADGMTTQRNGSTLQ